jgi:hypothetical protein
MSDPDEDLAFEFLGGQMVREPNGQITHRYLERGSDRERQARAALSRLLRNHDRELAVGIRWRLAALLGADHAHEPREIVIQPRKRGKQPDYHIDVQIAHDVAAAAVEGVQIEAAIADAMRHYGVSRSRAFRAWKKHGMVWVKAHGGSVN